MAPNKEWFILIIHADLISFLQGSIIFTMVLHIWGCVSKRVSCLNIEQVTLWILKAHFLVGTKIRLLLKFRYRCVFNNVWVCVWRSLFLLLVFKLKNVFATYYTVKHFMIILQIKFDLIDDRKVSLPLGKYWCSSSVIVIFQALFASEKATSLFKIAGHVFPKWNILSFLSLFINGFYFTLHTFIPEENRREWLWTNHKVLMISA